MTRIDLLEQLKAETTEATKELLLPVMPQKGDETPEKRPAEVHLMRLPDSKNAKRKAPYIIQQLITGKDAQTSGQTESFAVVRSIFCVYSENEQEGALLLLNLMERLRMHLLQKQTIAQRYQLLLESGLESIAYPDETAPFFAGEMVSTWRIPAVEREVDTWL